MGRPIGRRTKCTKKLTDRMCELLEIGFTHRLACKAVGITPKTFYAWRVRGEEQKRGLFRDFLQRTSEAEAKCLENVLATIQIASIEGNWKAAAWVAERRFRYSQKTEITGADGGPIVIDTTMASDEALDAALAKLDATPQGGQKVS